jgi:phospholipase C
MGQWEDRAKELAARRIERRKFLKGALGVSGLALLEGTRLARAVRPFASLPPSGTDAPIGPIVVTMMENRSADHYLGWYSPINPDGFDMRSASNPRSLAPLPPLTACPQTESLGTDDARPVNAFHLEQHCQIPDPDHGWNGSRIEFNQGRMNGFADRSGEVAMGYYEEEDLPFLAWLVREYTTFSRYHCSVMGPTFPNRLYLMSAQGGTAKNNAIPAPSPSNPMPDGYTWPTIFERLTAAGVEWAAYGSDVPQIALFFHVIRENPGRVRHITDYFADAAAGALPPVVFLDPAFFTYGNDDHPAHDIKFGQRYMQDVFLALADGPQWYDQTTGKGAAFVLTYDEHGGFFDHVPPPTTADERPSTDHCENWGQMGFRVPTVLASPFSQQGFVGTNLYDHTSILKFIEWRFGLAPLTARDAAANNIGEVLDLAMASPRAELTTATLPSIPIHAASLYCAQNQAPEETEGFNPLERIPDADAPAPTAKRIIPPPPGEVPHAELLAIADSGVLGRGDMRERAKHGVWRD